MFEDRPRVRELNVRRVTWRTGWERWTLDATWPVGSRAGSCQGGVVLQKDGALTVAFDWDEIRDLQSALVVLMESVGETWDPDWEPDPEGLPPLPPGPRRSGLPWPTEDDQELLRRHAAGETVRALADHFERTAGAITSRLGKLGARDDEAATPGGARRPSDPPVEPGAA